MRPDKEHKGRRYFSLLLFVCFVGFIEGKEQVISLVLCLFSDVRAPCMCVSLSGSKCRSGNVRSELGLWTAGSAGYNNS